MVSTGVPTLDNLLGSDGYPDKSAILVVGPPGIGKEALGYWFIRSGLTQGDYCLYRSAKSLAPLNPMPFPQPAALGRATATFQQS